MRRSRRTWPRHPTATTTATAPAPPRRWRAAARSSRKPSHGSAAAIDGSSVLVHTLAANDLIDEYRLIVYPLVLGGGKKVFADGVRLDLRLVEGKPLPTGVVLTHYVVDRPG